MNFENEEDLCFDVTIREERRKRAKEARLKQVEFYQAWSQALEREGLCAANGYGGSESSGKATPRRKGVNVGFTAKDRLRDAVVRSDIEEVRSILSQESAAIPSVDVISEGNGLSLLHTCCVNEDIEGVRLLLQHGANVNVQDNDLWTPLHVAAACGTMEIVKLLLEYGADATMLDVDGNFPSDNTDSPEVLNKIMRHLQAQGVHEKDLAGIRCRQAKNLITAIDDCIICEETTDSLNENGAAFLHIAAANGYCEVVKLLLDAGANINVLDDHGYTPLHLAARFNQVKATKLLLKRKASTQVYSNNGELAIDLAENDEILRYLEFACGGKKLKRIPSMLRGHLYLAPISSPKTSLTDVLGPPSPSLRRSSMSGGRARLYSIDMGEFQRERTRSIPKVMKTKQSLAKLEEVYESTTLEERDTFDEGADLSMQGPILDKLKGCFLKRRHSERLLLPDAAATDNLATLPDLTEDIVLNYLQQRYAKDQIYTYIGEILVAVNPFKELGFYTDLVSEQYSSDPPDQTLPPHIFAVANQVYHNMMREEFPQCCVISGESGAGKTETCKLIVQQLLFVAESEEMGLNIKIEQVNPILETFGNAKTVMNDNSSRFGKYLELVFSEEGKLLGATFKEYLLEKLRVVRQACNERNFHIFYLMFAGLEQEEKDRLRLRDFSSHRCLCSSDMHIDEEMLEFMAAQFQEVRDSLYAVGFSSQDEMELLEVLAAVLHICDVAFEYREDDSSGGSSAGGGMVVSSETHVDMIAELLQVEPDDLLSCLTTETIFTRGEEIVRGRNEVQANDSRDAVAKALYGRMFSWIVNGINHHLKPEDVHQDHNLKIGLLDIFGFEKFEHNSFEQVCINIANEQLQFYFNEHIFQWEIDECSKEGVVLDAINYTSNAHILDVFLDKNAGLFALLDEESRFPRATDQSLALKLHQSLGTKNNGVYHAPPNRGTRFGVAHYAGYVEYDIVGFLDKNRDTLSPAISSLMRSSSSVLIREIFGVQLTRTGSVAASLRQSRSRKEESPFAVFNMKTSRRMSKMMKTGFPRRQPKSTDTAKRKAPTVANHFKNSLKELMDKMNSANPHFIRCVKPNSLKQPMNYDTAYVQTQLRYTGVMETTRIRKCGYPIRMTFEDFLRRYILLEVVYAPSSSMASSEEKCRAILTSVGIEGWACGRSKVMLKFNHPAVLEAQCSLVHIKVVIVQRHIRYWLKKRQKLRLVEQRRQQKEQVQSFFACLTEASHKCFRKQVLLNRIDTRNYFRKKKEAEEKEKAARRLREEEERKRQEKERKRQEELKRLEEERKHQEEERKHQEEELKRQEEEHKLQEEERKRQEEERKHKEKEEEKRRKDLEGGKHKEFEDRGGIQEDGKGLRRTENTEAFLGTRKATLENLKRSSAVVSGGQAARKKKSKVNVPGTELSTHSEAAEEDILVENMSSHYEFEHSKGNAIIRQNGRSQVGYQVRQNGWGENGFNLANGISGGQNGWVNGLEDSVEDLNQESHKPITMTFEPAPAVLNRPKRHLMKIRSNPLTNSGEIMVVSAGTANESHAGDFDDMPINGYSVGESPVISNGSGMGSSDGIIMLSSGPLSGGSNFGNGIHVQNKIVLKDDDDDYDDTTSPMHAGDRVEEIYENTTSDEIYQNPSISVAEDAQVSNLAKALSDDNIYEEVETEEPASPPNESPASEYCQPVPSKYALHFPDFDQKPAKYTDPASLMNLSPIQSAVSGNVEVAGSPSRVTEQKGATSPLQSLGETTSNDDEIYENSDFSSEIYENNEILVKHSQATSNESKKPVQRQAIAKQGSKLSYSTGFSPMDDEDYEDARKLPLPKKHSAPSISPQSNHRNVSLDGDVFLPNSHSSSSSVYNKTQHSSNANFRRRPGTKLKKSSSSSSAADPLPSLSESSSQSSVGGSQEVLNGPDVKVKSPVSPRKNRKGLKNSQSESNCAALASRLQNSFVPTTPLPPIPSEVLPPPSSRTNMPLPPTPSLPSLPNKKVVVKDRSSSDTDYDYIGSNTLEKALNSQKTEASPYLTFQHQHQPNVPIGPPQPYTEPIQRKTRNSNMKTSSSTSHFDPVPVPPPHKKHSAPVLLEHPIDCRPPALPPVVLSKNRPPAPLPSEAMQGASSGQPPLSNHQPLSHTKSLYTQESPSSSNGKSRQHPPLRRGESAAVLTRGQKAVVRSPVPSHRGNNQSPSPPSTSPNRSPLIPPRFPSQLAPPPSKPPPAAPAVTTPPNTIKDVTPTSVGAAPPPPPPPTVPPPKCPPSSGTVTKTSSPLQKRKVLTPTSSLTEISAVKLKKVNSPPTASSSSSISRDSAPPLSQNSLVAEIQALKLKQRMKVKAQPELPGRRKRSNSEENILSVSTEEKDTTVTKLRASSSVHPTAQMVDDVKPALNKSSSSTSLLTSETVSSAPSASKSPSSTSAESNAMPEWKRLLLEKKQQQQLQKQQSKGALPIPQKTEVKDEMPQWKKALLEKKAKGQH